MAVHYGPEAGESERIISSGGNIYTLAHGYVKTGVATRGRGFWVGKKLKDKCNPQVDSFKDGQARVEDTKELLVPEDEEHDGFDDNDDIATILARHSGKLSGVVKPQLKAARQMVEAAAGSNFGKSVLTLGGVKVDLLLSDPDDLGEDQLVKSAELISQLMPTVSPREQEILMHHANRVAKAIREVMEAKDILARSILTKDPAQKQAAAEAPTNPAKMPPQKAQTAQVNDKGKVAYQYPKKGDGKGPNSEGFGGKAKPQQGPEPQEQAPPNTEISQPQPIDPSKFAELIGVSAKQLGKLAGKKTKSEFVDYFMRYEELTKKHGIQRGFLGRLYDALSTPQPPPQAPPQQAPAAKGIMFKPNGDGIMNMLVKGGVSTVEDMRGKLQKFYSCDGDMAARMTRSLLRRWEGEGSVSYWTNKE